MANTTWNLSDKSANVTLSGGNLTATQASGSTCGVRAAHQQSAGKYYWECTCTTFGGIGGDVGFATLSASFSTTLAGVTAPVPSVAVAKTGPIWSNAVNSGSTLGTINNGNVVCVAVDLSGQRIWFRLGAAGNWNGSGTANPATGTGGVAITLGNGVAAYPQINFNAVNDTFTANFGDAAFTGSVPSGFTAGFPTVPGGGAAAAQSRAMILA